MCAITADGWDHPLIADHVHAALAVKFAFAEAVLLITFFANIVYYVFLLGLSFFILG